MNVRIRLTPLLIIAAISLLLLPVASFAEDGKAIFVIGKVEVMHANGDKSRLKRGSTISSGDIIVTSGRGQVQIKMADGTLLAVRPDSEFVISDYQYNKDIANDKSVYNLVKGGFRSITGKMGKAKKSSYAVKTVVGTIGIRGTDFTARICESNCGDQENGLYVGVMQGGVVLANNGGELNVSPGDFGYMPDADIQPSYLDTMPGDLLFSSTSKTNDSLNSASNETSTANEALASSAITQLDLLTDELMKEEIITTADPVVTTPPADTTQPEPTIMLPTSGSADYIADTFTQQIDGVDASTLDVSKTTLAVNFLTTDVTATIVSDVNNETWTAESYGMQYDTTTGAYNGNMTLNITPLFGATRTSDASTVSGALGAIPSETPEVPLTATLDYVLNDTSTVVGHVDMTVLNINP